MDDLGYGFTMFPEGGWAKELLKHTRAMTPSSPRTRSNRSRYGISNCRKVEQIRAQGILELENFRANLELSFYRILYFS